MTDEAVIASAATRSRSGARRRAEVSPKLRCSGSKCEAAAGAAQHQFLRHFFIGEIDKILPAAMHRHHVLDVEFLKLRHDLAQIVVGRRCQVKAADESVNLYDTADLLSPFQCVDNTGVPAGADDHQPTVAEPETSGVLVPMLVWLRLASQLLRAEMMVCVGTRVAPQSVLDSDLDPSIGEHVLDAGARHDARGEGMALDDDWILGQHGFDVQRVELAAVECIEIGQAAVGVAEEAVAKIVLAAGIEAQILAHLRPSRLEEPDQPAVMVEVPMTEN